MESETPENMQTIEEYWKLIGQYYSSKEVGSK